MFALTVERVNAGEQGGVQRDPQMMPRQFRCVVAVDRLKRVIGGARGQIVEHAADPVQQFAATFHGVNGVRETRSFAGTGNRGDFRLMLYHRAVESGRKMLRPDPGERRQLEGRVPGREKRVLGHVR